MNRYQAALAYSDAWNMRSKEDKRTKELLDEAEDPIFRDLVAFSIHQAEEAFGRLYVEGGEILKVGNFCLDNEQKEAIVIVVIKIPKKEQWTILEAAIHKFMTTGYCDGDFPTWLADIVVLGFNDEANNPVSIQSSNLSDERTLIMTIFERY